MPEVEPLLHDVEAQRQVGEHARVLRALAGEQEGQLGPRRAARCRRTPLRVGPAATAPRPSRRRLRACCRTFASAGTSSATIARRCCAACVGARQRRGDLRAAPARGCGPSARPALAAASSERRGVSADSRHSSAGQRSSRDGRRACGGACSTMRVGVDAAEAEGVDRRRAAACPSGAIQGAVWVLTKSGVLSMPSSGLTWSHSVGGSTRWCSASGILIRLGDAGRRDAVADHRLHRAERLVPCGAWRARQNTAFSAAISVRSPSGMPVPWASTRPTVAGSTPLAS